MEDRHSGIDRIRRLFAPRPQARASRLPSLNTWQAAMLWLFTGTLLVLGWQMPALVASQTDALVVEQQRRLRYREQKHWLLSSTAETLRMAVDVSPGQLRGTLVDLLASGQAPPGADVHRHEFLSTEASSTRAGGDSWSAMRLLIHGRMADAAALIELLDWIAQNSPWPSSLRLCRLERLPATETRRDALSAECLIDILYLQSASS